MANKTHNSSQSNGSARLMMVAACLLAGLVSIIAGCSGAPEVGSDDPVLNEGREIYIRNCAGCHGISGGGATGPKLADGAVSATYPDIDDQMAIVGDGKDQMPGFANKLSDAEIEAVVRYTREIL